MTEKARVIAIDGRRVSVVPLDLEVCLGCSNDQCKSEGSVFTVINRRKFPLSIGSEVRVHARPGRQLLQGAVSVGLLSLVSGGVLVLALSVRLSECRGLANDFLAGGNSGLGGVSALWREKKGMKVPYGLAMTAGFCISLFV